MSIEVWTSDETGTMVLMPESPDPDAPHGGAPQADAPQTHAAPEPTHADELRALRTMIESRDQERAAREAQRDTQLATMERLVRGEDLTPPAATTPAASVRPKSEDFSSHEEYVEAAADWKATEKLDAFRAEQHHARQQEAQRAQLQSRSQAVRTQEEAFIADHPDYVDVVTRGLVAKAPQEFRQLMSCSTTRPRWPTRWHRMRRSLADCSRCRRGRCFMPWAGSVRPQAGGRPPLPRRRPNRQRGVTHARPWRPAGHRPRQGRRWRPRLKARGRPRIVVRGRRLQRAVAYPPRHGHSAAGVPVGQGDTGTICRCPIIDSGVPMVGVVSNLEQPLQKA